MLLTIYMNERKAGGPTASEVVICQHDTTESYVSGYVLIVSKIQEISFGMKV